MRSLKPCSLQSLVGVLLTRLIYAGELCGAVLEWNSFRDIASSLNVSVGTAFNVFKIFSETGDIDPKHREYSAFVTDRMAMVILAIIFENPSLYLKEITQKMY